LRRFIALLKANLQPKVDLPLGDIFVSDNFLMGVVNTETQDFFILLKVRSTADVFESMHAWENKMFIDLGLLFSVAVSPETKYLLTKDFDDCIIENKNARILLTKITRW
jgi:hypothetical protein